MYMYILTHTYICIYTKSYPAFKRERKGEGVGGLGLTQGALLRYRGLRMRNLVSSVAAALAQQRLCYPGFPSRNLLSRFGVGLW